MATLRDIQRRIRSVQSTQKITKAMKLVAASKLRRAQERITAARPYAIKMGELLSGLVGRTEGDAHPLLARRTTGRKRLVVITADKGLCGAFNSNILRASLAFLREQGNVDVTLVVVGRKARDFYRRRSWQVKSEMLGFFDRLAYAHAQELANELMQSYLGGGSGRGLPDVQRVPLGRGAAGQAPAAPADRGGSGGAGSRHAPAETISSSRAPTRSWRRSCHATSPPRCSGPSWSRWPENTARA